MKSKRFEKRLSSKEKKWNSAQINKEQGRSSLKAPCPEGTQNSQAMQELSLESLLGHHGEWQRGEKKSGLEDRGGRNPDGAMDVRMRTPGGTAGTYFLGM